VPSRRWRKSVQWRRGGVACIGEASRRWQRPSLDRIRGKDVGGVTGGAVNLVLRASAPTFLYSAVRRGPTNHVGLGVPDQGARTRSKRPLGLTGGRSNLTFSP
jgi:hypothetical protein